jgi:G:T-mismatch repair DNA endonuclease (very short patch repair protein)
MVPQTLRKTSKTRQETDFRLVPALLEQFWSKDSPCPVPFLQALTDRLMQHGLFQRWRKEDPEVRERLFSALLRLDAGRGLVLPFVEACLPHENHPQVLAALIESWPPGLVCPETIWQQWCEKTRPPVNADNGDQQKLRQLAWKALFQLDAGRGLVLPFVEACLPHENHPEVLAGLIESWPSGLVCPETIWQQWCKKTQPPVKADNGDQQKLRQLAWKALLRLPAPQRDPTGSPRQLSFLRQQLKFETSPRVLKSIWSGLNRLGRWSTSAEERTAWLAELERHSPRGSKASDRFATLDALLREAIIWRVLFGMHVRVDKTDPSVLSRELLSRYLSDYLKTPSCLRDEDAPSLLLKTMAMLPAMEHDRRAWLDTWEETGAMTGGSSVSRKAFWEVMVRAQKAGLYPAEETMEAAIRALGSETHPYALNTAAAWVPPAGWLQKLWADFWELHLFNTSSEISEMAWRAWRPAGDGYETFCSRLMKTPRKLLRKAPGHLLRWHRTEITQERWHAWWAQWVRQESDPRTFEELSRAMRHWQPLPEVIMSAWRERGQGGKRNDQRVRRLAWRVLVSQPVDLSRDIIRHLPGETDPTVLETMAGWSPAATPVPADFWEEWGKKFAILSSFSHDNGSFLLNPLVTCCLKWRPATPDQIQEMWTMWEKIFTHCPTDRVKYTLKLLSNAPFLAPPASPRLLNLVINERYEFSDIVRIFSTEGELMENISSFFTDKISDPLLWEQAARGMISKATKYDYWRTIAYPERKDCLKSFQWICEHSPARGQGLLPGWNTLRPVLEKLSASPEVELFFFSLVLKWGSPEGWQAWWEMAAAIEKNHDHFVFPGGCCGMIRRVYLVERLAASLASCGEGADGATLRRLFRQLKQQCWRAEDVKLWQWLSELVEKAGATGQEPGFRLVSSQASLSSAGMCPSGARLPTWEPLPKPGCASGFSSPFVSPSLS